ncbi:MAG: hypothetical protein ABIR81_11585 [Ginsengibacter sp.]
MEKEIIETVLTEMLGELQQIKKLSTDNTNVAIENANRLIAIEKKMQSAQATKPEINTQSIEHLIYSGLQRIKETIDKKPTPVKREFRILLFPTYNEKEYYRIVFGRIIAWLVLLVIVKYLYLLGSAWIAAH